MLWVSRYNLCSLQLDTILILLLFCLFISYKKSVQRLLIPALCLKCTIVKV